MAEQSFARCPSACVATINFNSLLSIFSPSLWIVPAVLKYLSPQGLKSLAKSSLLLPFLEKDKTLWLGVSSWSVFKLLILTISPLYFSHTTPSGFTISTVPLSGLYCPTLVSNVILSNVLHPCSVRISVSSLKQCMSFGFSDNKVSAILSPPS